MVRLVTTNGALRKAFQSVRWVLLHDLDGKKSIEILSHTRLV